MTGRCSELALTWFAVVDVMLSWGNQANALIDHIVSTSGEEAERPFEDSMLRIKPSQLILW